MDKESVCSKSRHTDGKHFYDSKGVCYFCSHYKPKPAPVQKCPGTFPLTYSDINSILIGFEMNGYIVAAQARIEGMKAYNAYNKRAGYGQEYNGAQFMDEADNIKTYAQQLQLMRTAKEAADKMGAVFMEGGPVGEGTKTDS